MKSPFPGMDPYLEQYWGDVHTSLITYARDQLRLQLPRDLRVRIEEQVDVQIASDEDGPSKKRRTFTPDVRVVEQPARGAEAAPGGVATSVAEALLVPLDSTERTQRSLRIVDAHSGNRVVTAIEFLSPANKAEPVGRTSYRRKQAELREAGVNLVEVDLVRAGAYVLAAPVHHVPLPYLAPYRVCVVRSGAADAEMYRVSLREPLPTFRVPLRASDADVYLHLQHLIDRSYENGGYAEDIDYRVEPQPPLQGDDATWADALLKEKGYRPAS